MAYANAHVKITIFGTSCGGAEEWSTGFRMGSEDPGSGNFAIGAGFLDDLGPAWQTFFTGGNTNIHPMWKTDGIKAALILANGTTDLANVETFNYSSPISGGGSGNPFPPQISLVAQLAAASPVGLGSKGRMYLPGVNHGLSGGGTLGATEQGYVANALATFFELAETSTNSPGYVMNASKGRPGIPFTAPVNRRVTSVRIGSVYDTQRRRRNGLTEVYVGANIEP